ncbi:MAG TPA: Si-specific NAD(P)(+) transhydrogenase [Terriglobia bacterium]|jgi:NAD(P) transhydrogenase|nr:Si-specific NAD(P)(+) transhydrogenase [Terriglobia bacterium]
MPTYDYDLLVIGSGPAGQRAAIQSAKLRKRVALAERKTVVGGICINTGTIPSKTLREAVLYLSGYRERAIYGESYTVKQKITIDDLLFRTDYVIRHEIEVIRHQLLRNGVELLTAEASFVDPHTLKLNFVEDSDQRTVTAGAIVIATGSEATRDPSIPFDGQNIFVSDDILGLKKLPRTLAVIGAGVIGCEYASIFAALGVRVTLVDRQSRLLPFVDSEIIESLEYHLREDRMTIWLRESVSGIELADSGADCQVKVHLASGKQITAEKALYSIGRTGATARLNLPAAGLTADERGRLKVNENYQTDVPHIYAVGDVIGFPSLASTSMEQGRLAACHAFGVQVSSAPALFPYGIYTIPEISYVGRNEEQLTQENVPYEVGKAGYREIARGQILGDRIGMLKLIFHRETRRLLGVHIIGESASELIHIGQAVLTFGGTIDYFVNNVFNYPTLAECYKNAAFDGINRLNG